MAAEYTKSLDKGQKIVITLAKPITAANTPTVIDGKPDWRTTNPAIADVIATSDGLGATIFGLGYGTCDVFIRGDADMTAAQKFVETVTHVTVQPEPAVGFELTFQPPVPAS